MLAAPVRGVNQPPPAPQPASQWRAEQAGSQRRCEHNQGGGHVKVNLDLSGNLFCAQAPQTYCKSHQWRVSGFDFAVGAFRSDATCAQLYLTLLEMECAMRAQRFRQVPNCLSPASPKPGMM